MYSVQSSRRWRQYSQLVPRWSRTVGLPRALIGNRLSQVRGVSALDDYERAYSPIREDDGVRRGAAACVSFLGLLTP